LISKLSQGQASIKKIPAFADRNYWAKATGLASLVGMSGDCGELAVNATGLIPAGLYTVWFATNKGPLPGGPLGIQYPGRGRDPNVAVVDHYGDELEVFKAPQDGIVLWIRTRSTTFPGEEAVIFGEIVEKIKP